MTDGWGANGGGGGLLQGPEVFRRRAKVFEVVMLEKRRVGVLARTGPRDVDGNVVGEHVGYGDVVVWPIVAHNDASVVASNAHLPHRGQKEFRQDVEVRLSRIELLVKVRNKGARVEPLVPFTKGVNRGGPSNAVRTVRKQALERVEGF